MGTPESKIIVTAVIVLISIAMVAGSVFLAKMGRTKGEGF